MSKLSLPNGDDHPDAAGKHLMDAIVLERSGRYDGAAYLSGYVVECCMKTFVIIETGPPQRTLGHNLRSLSIEALRLAGLSTSKTAKYKSSLTKEHMILGWRETLRYHAPGSVPPAKAQTWLKEADAIYKSTIVQMRLDGLI